MTSDLDRLTRSDLRLTSRMKAEALSGSLIIGLCLVGVTQYSCVVVNILVVFNMLPVFLFLSFGLGTAATCGFMTRPKSSQI